MLKTHFRKRLEYVVYRTLPRHAMSGDDIWEDTRQKLIEEILSLIESELVGATRLVCSAEENEEAPNDGCDCARYNEAVDEILYKLREK